MQCERAMIRSTHTPFHNLKATKDGELELAPGQREEDFNTLTPMPFFSD